jgi:RNA polymerase sigma-70 factor (ECF subfamily)
MRRRARVPGVVAERQHARSSGRLDGDPADRFDGDRADPTLRGGQAPTPGGTDDALVRALYEQHARPLLSFALRLTNGDWQRAEDIVQETLLRAWRHPEAFARSTDAVRPWLFTVARNIAVDGFRARKARPPEAGPDGLDVIAVDDDVERALEAWQVTDALASLSVDHRRVLLETFYRGRSVAEAAVALGVPPGTVKSRTYYALRALRLILEEQGVTEA